MLPGSFVNESYIYSFITMKSIYFFLTCLLFSVLLKAQSDKSMAGPDLNVGAGLVIDHLLAIKGGRERGNASLALFKLDLRHSVINGKLLKNTRLNASISASSDRSPSEVLIGDIQVASNIEGYTRRLIYELYVETEIREISIIAGIHDLNSVFMYSSHCSPFT